MSETWARRAPLLGIAAAVIALISIIVGGTSTPDVDAPARDVINHYDDSAQVISAIAGALAALLSLVARLGANVVDVEHLRDGLDLHVRETAIKLVLETRGPEHGREIVEAARADGFSVRVEHEA